MSDRSDEIQQLRERLIEAIYHAGEKRNVSTHLADVVLDALGLVQVGWMVWEDPQDSDSWFSVDLDFEDLSHYPHRPLFTAALSGSSEHD